MAGDLPRPLTFGPGETLKAVTFDRIAPDRYASLVVTLNSPKGEGEMYCGTSMEDDPEHQSEEEKQLEARYDYDLARLKKQLDEGKHQHDAFAGRSAGNRDMAERTGGRGAQAGRRTMTRVAVLPRPLPDGFTAQEQDRGSSR